MPLHTKSGLASTVSSTGTSDSPVILLFGYLLLCCKRLICRISSFIGHLASETIQERGVLHLADGHSIYGIGVDCIVFHSTRERNIGYWMNFSLNV